MKLDTLIGVLAAMLLFPATGRADEAPIKDDAMCLTTAKLVGAACYDTAKFKTAAELGAVKDFCVKAAAVAYKGCTEGYLAQYLSRYSQDTCLAIGNYTGDAIKITCSMRHKNTATPAWRACADHGQAANDAIYRVCSAKAPKTNSI